jgi:hypothetical protein
VTVTRGLLIATATLAIVNGIASPFLLNVFLLYPLWYPGFLPVDSTLLVTLASLILSTILLMITGVPAALYELLVERGGTSVVSASIWFGCMVLATIPALPGIAALVGGVAPGG